MCDFVFDVVEFEEGVGVKVGYSFAFSRVIDFQVPSGGFRVGVDEGAEGGVKIGKGEDIVARGEGMSGGC